MGSEAKPPIDSVPAMMHRIARGIIRFVDKSDAEAIERLSLLEIARLSVSALPEELQEDMAKVVYKMVLHLMDEMEKELAKRAEAERNNV